MFESSHILGAQTTAKTFRLVPVRLCNPDDNSVALRAWSIPDVLANDGSILSNTQTR